MCRRKENMGRASAKIEILIELAIVRAMDGRTVRLDSIEFS